MVPQADLGYITLPGVAQKGVKIGLPEGLFWTPILRGTWAEITLTPVWELNVTMGYGPSE